MLRFAPAGCVACYAGSLSSASLKQDLLVASVTWRCYNLPLQKPLTTEGGDGYRRGFILQVQLRQGEALFGGIGEVAPLPGEPLSLLVNYIQVRPPLFCCSYPSA